MTKLSTLKRKMLADPEARKEYERLGPEFEISSELIAARKRAKLSQEDLANRMGTTQSAIARLESGQKMPMMQTIQRYAEATGSRVRLSLVRAKAGTGIKRS